MKTLDKSISEIGTLIGDKTRALILISLMEGKALTSGELALRSNISAQTASNHLNKLLKANLITCESIGRNHYYKIASEDVANAIETIAILTGSPKIILVQENKIDKDMCFARTCYDHLAGELGVSITNVLLKNKLLVHKAKSFTISNTGKTFFNELDISTNYLLTKRRPLARPCLDWTERKYHLAGSLGAALLTYFLTNKLLIQSKQKQRVVILTTKGELWIRDKLGIKG